LTDRMTLIHKRNALRNYRSREHRELLDGAIFPADPDSWFVGIGPHERSARKLLACLGGHNREQCPVITSVLHGVQHARAIHDEEPRVETLRQGCRAEGAKTSGLSNGHRRGPKWHATRIIRLERPRPIHDVDPPGRELRPADDCSRISGPA